MGAADAHFLSGFQLVGFDNIGDNINKVIRFGYGILSVKIFQYGFIVYLWVIP